MVSELSSHDLPCDTAQFDPWRKNFNIHENYQAAHASARRTVHGLAAGGIRIVIILSSMFTSFSGLTLAYSWLGSYSLSPAAAEEKIFCHEVQQRWVHTPGRVRAGT